MSERAAEAPFDIGDRVSVYDRSGNHVTNGEIDGMVYDATEGLWAFDVKHGHGRFKEVWETELSDV